MGDWMHSDTLWCATTAQQKRRGNYGTWKEKERKDKEKKKKKKRQIKKRRIIKRCESGIRTHTYIEKSKS